LKPANAIVAGFVPDLSDIPETMLWSLYNRATEAQLSDGVLNDPDSVRIHAALDYDFFARFGEPAGSLAVRAAEIDRVLRQWMLRHPNGCVVSLGEGLETQARRVDNGHVRWLSVDLPDAIRLRERFLPPTERFRHLAMSALDPAWMAFVDESDGVFIVAQGLLMYLEPERVQRLFHAIAERFTAADLVFDVVPRWFSRLTLFGLRQTPQYELPPMPWGIDRDEIEGTLQSWHGRFGEVAFLDYRVPRGLPRLLLAMVEQIPCVRHELPCLIHVSLDTLDKKDSCLTLKKSLSGDAQNLSDVLAKASDNADRSGDLAVAAGGVIAKRVAIGVAAAFDPLQADHGELARMVPEKLQAFTAAGMIMLRQTEQATRQMSRFASDEIATTTLATMAMASCTTPAALVLAQTRLALGCFERASAHFLAMSMLILNGQDAALAPIRETVATNAERLGAA
jgi:O-methyltransferase involved in polyketide biosynthesis